MMNCRTEEAKISNKLTRLGLFPYIPYETEVYLEEKEGKILHLIVIPCKNKEGAIAIGIRLAKRMNEYPDEYIRLLVNRMNKEIQAVIREMRQ